MITSIRLVNFKNFVDETSRVGPFTTIVGTTYWTVTKRTQFAALGSCWLTPYTPEDQVNSRRRGFRP